LIHYQLAILSIDILELPTGKDHPGCVINPTIRSKFPKHTNFLNSDLVD
jgi:hypothetical protein